MKLKVVSRGVVSVSLPLPNPGPDNTNVTNNDTNNIGCDEEFIKKEAPDNEQGLVLALFTPDLDKSLPSSSTTPPCQGKAIVKSRDLNDLRLTLPAKRKTKPSSKSKLALSDMPIRIVREKATPPQFKSATVIRAEEMQAGLGSEFPSFVKLLVRSHVSSCFWMGLPMPFCKFHLPNRDVVLILEDENGDRAELKYIAEKTGLSAGWRKFAVGHKLLEGDVLLFHLVEPLKFKVYVVRQNELTDVDGALSLLNLDVKTKQPQPEGGSFSRLKTLLIRKRKRPSASALIQKKNKKMLVSRSVRDLGQLREQSGNDSEEFGSEVLEGSKLSKTLVPFKDVKSFEDFHIVVNDLCIDSELPEHIRLKYYELCCKKNAFLHSRFLPGLYSKLAAGIIGETVNIADAIKSCKLTTSWDEFAVWEKSLKSFELLGMKVGFIRHRMHTLRGLAFETQGASDFKNYLGAISKRIHAEDEIRNLEAKLVELKAACENYDADIEMLRSKAEKHESEFQEEVDAPW
ncbi:hypothetical protein ACET3Z_026912 [Daucus carota]